MYSQAAAVQRSKKTAIIYLCVGGGILAVSTALMLTLYFTQGFVYWYFIFAMFLGLVMLVYGLVMLVSYCRNRNAPAPAAATTVREVRYGPGLYASQQGSFAASQVPLEVRRAQQRESQYGAEVAEEERLPAPSAPPPQFIQETNDDGVDTTDETTSYAFKPVEYGT